MKYPYRKIIGTTALVWISLMGLCLGAQPQPVAQAAPVATQKKLSQPVLPVQAESVQPRIYVLCLHDVGKPHGVSMTTSPAHVNDYITKLKKDGYTFLSLADYVAMSKLERPVPAKAVMLSFDDGYESFYKRDIPYPEEAARAGYDGHHRLVDGQRRRLRHQDVYVGPVQGNGSVWPGDHSLSQL